MDQAELKALLHDLESDRVERKESASDGTKIREAICAFANDMPNYRQSGLCYIGVKDNGSCAELEITDQLLLTLSDMRSDGNIIPIPSMTVSKHQLGGCEIAVIEVQPSMSPPVRYKGRVHIRVGPRRAIASIDEERQLNEKRKANDLPFDLHPLSSAKLQDMSLELFRNSYLPSAVAADTLKENGRSDEQKLASLRFSTTDTPPVPTVLGILTIGKSPSDYVPGAYVQFLRFQGSKLSDPIADQKEIHGPVLEVLTQLDGVLKANIQVATDITSSNTELNFPDYPLAALQQYVRNAVMHRNYETSHAPIKINWFSDRIEIQSPGGPYGQVTCENFGQPGITDYRNPNLAGAMKDLGYVQRFGVGLATALELLKGNGNPSPEVTPEASHVLITVRARTSI